jgi:hypothetical protein
MGRHVHPEYGVKGETLARISQATFAPQWLAPVERPKHGLTSGISVVVRFASISTFIGRSVSSSYPSRKIKIDIGIRFSGEVLRGHLTSQAESYVYF